MTDTPVPSSPEQTPAPEPPSSPATATTVVPGEGGGSAESPAESPAEGEALTGDGAPREEEGDGLEEEDAPDFPDDDRLAEMLAQSKQQADQADGVRVDHPEPIAVETDHVVQDNVSDPEHPEATLATGVTEQDNVSGSQSTSYADGSMSEHGDLPVTGDAAGAPLDPTLARGTLDPSQDRDLADEDNPARETPNLSDPDPS